MSERETVRETRTVIDLSGCLVPFVVIYGGLALLLVIAAVLQQVLYG